MSDDRKDVQQNLLHRDISTEGATLETEKDIVLFKLGWHAGFSAGIEVSRDIIDQSFRKSKTKEGN